MTKVKKFAGVAATLCLSSLSSAYAGVVTDWNATTLNCVQGPITPANRGGPAGLLDIALVHAAMHDAVQAVQGRFESYEYENAARRGLGSPEAAAAAAAYGVLVGLYEANDPCLVDVVDPAVTYAGDAGLQAGNEAANALLPLHRPAFTLPTDPWLGNNELGQWRLTPGVTQGAATFMAHTAPFAMSSPAQFRPAPPPHLQSWRYVLDYAEVKLLGSQSSKYRTPQQTEAARFWTSNFFSQWNQAVRAIAEEHVSDVGDQARLFALVSFAAADSQISVYDAKYRYNFWRPLTAIHEGDHDGNWLTVGDSAWAPFISMPPYPEYSSGANCLTAAITKVLKLYFGTDQMEFSIWTTAQNATINPRTYRRFSEVENEMVGVRIWQGIHFRTAEEVGRHQGSRIGDWTFKKYLRPM